MFNPVNNLYSRDDINLSKRWAELCTLLHEHAFFVLFNALTALPTCCIIINCPTPKQWSILLTCTAGHMCCIIIVCSIMFTVSGQWHQPTGIGCGLCRETREPQENTMQFLMCRTTCCRKAVRLLACQTRYVATRLGRVRVWRCLPSTS